MLNTSFEGVESGSGSDVSSSQTIFRRVALLRDTNSGGSNATATTLRATKAIRFDDFTSTPMSTFTVDEEINQASTGGVGKVVEWDATNRVLYYIQTRFNDEGVDSNGNQTVSLVANVVTGQGGTTFTGTLDTGFSSTVNGSSFTSGYSVQN